MPWNFRFNKRQFATVKPNWQHTAPQIRALMEKQPPGADRKFLECLLYLRLGYKMAQVADMTNLESSTIRQHVKTYNKSGLKDYEPKVEKPKVEKSVQVAEKPLPRKKPSFKIGVTPRQGTLAFLRIGYTLYDGGKEKDTIPHRVIFLAYIKTIMEPRDHLLALEEIAKELKIPKGEVLRILRSYPS